MDSKNIDWDELIKKHYDCVSVENPSYAKKYGREEMKEFWYKLINFCIKNNRVDEIYERIIYCSTPKEERGWFHPGA
jgi:hypothetical protein